VGKEGIAAKRRKKRKKKEVWWGEAPERPDRLSAEAVFTLSKDGQRLWTCRAAIHDEPRLGASVDLTTIF